MQTLRMGHVKKKNFFHKDILNKIYFIRIFKDTLNKIFKKEVKQKDIPGGLVVKTQHFHCWGPGSIPGRGTKVPEALLHGQKKRRKKT